MSHAQLESTLRNLAQIGQRLHRTSAREVWRFEFDGKPYRVHFYPRSSGAAHVGRGNPALNELRAFQLLQKAEIASPRAVSALVGFRLGDRLGDALLLQSIEPATDLQMLAERGVEPKVRRQIFDRVIAIMQKLAAAKLGHSLLSLNSFALSGDEVFLIEANGVNRRGLKLRDIQRLAHDAAPYLTQTDLVCAWAALGQGGAPPAVNKLSNVLWRRFIATTRRESEHFGRLKIGQWPGVFTRHSPRRFAWAPSSEMTITSTDWQTAWPKLLARIDSPDAEFIKRGDSGDVLAATIELAGRSLDVIIKRPRRKFWWRHITGIGRPSRAARSWIKTWKMLIRDVPCEFPLLLMERRRFGYAIESMAVFERVPGDTLASADLEKLAASDRKNLFRRVGRTLRRIESLGFTHTDAKSTNWIVFADPLLGPRPILIDVDGVRHYRWAMMGIERILRAMKQHQQYTPADSFELCAGYAPRARIAVEEADRKDDKVRG